MKLLEIIKRQAEQIGVPNDAEIIKREALAKDCVYFATLNMARLQFHIYQHPVSGIFFIVIPLCISEYIIVGWVGCKNCERLAAWIPEMDHVTVGPEPDGMLQTKIKSMLPKKINGFPVLLRKDGGAFVTPLEISITLGFPIEIESEV